MSEVAEILEEQEELQEVAVLDDASAQMLLARIREANEQYERMEAWYNHQQSKAKEIRDRTIAWAENSLRGYFDMVPTHDTKTKRVYELPGGTLTLAKQEPKYEVNDEKLVTWLKGNQRSDLIKVTEEAKWGDLKKEMKPRVMEDGSLVTSDGEIIPGVTATARKDKFTVKVK